MEPDSSSRRSYKGSSCLSLSHCSKSSFFVQKVNFDFTRKIVKKNLGEKLVKMLGFYQNVIFGQKFDF